MMHCFLENATQEAVILSVVTSFFVSLFRRPYDIFQVSEREFEESDAIFKEILKLVRLLMYVVLFCAILGGAVVNRLSIMLLVSGINKVRQPFICALTHYHTVPHFDAQTIYIIVENMVRKGEFACYKQFLLFSQCFQAYMAINFHFKCTLKCRLQFVSILNMLTFCRLVMC